jgi:membrane protein
MGIVKFFARIFFIKVIIDRWKRDKAAGKPMPTRASLASSSSSSVRTAPIPAAKQTPPAAKTSPAESTDVPKRGGPSPESPLDLDAPDWKATLKRTVKEIKQDRIPMASAGMAYYLFLAIFPGLIAMIGIFKLFELDASGVIGAIERNVPGGAGAVLKDALVGPEKSETASLIATVVGIALALFSGSSGFVALQSGLNIAYDIDEDRKLIGARTVALLLLLATALLGGVPSPFFTFGEDLIFKIVGWILTVAAISTLFSIYYYVAPNRPQRPPWKWVSAGGVVGTILWILGSVGFGFYASNFGNYGKTYGTLSGVIILIFWLFLSALSVLVGGELNAELERQAAAKSGTSRR